MRRPGPSTRCVHAGDDLDPLGALSRPLYASSTFGFPSTERLLEVVEGRAEGAFYSRYGSNPTVVALERKLADLEGAERALAFASGMAAISATLLSLARDGGAIACLGGLYGGTLELVRDRLPELGVRTVLTADPALEGLGDDVRAVLFETPTNPLLDVIDIAAVCRRAHELGALAIVDNTFASPINQNPLEHGADLVVHSATKYLGGHSDLTAGAVMGAAGLLEPVARWRLSLGQVAAPETAFLLQRSLRTLAVRVEAHNARAAAVAAFLEGHPRVLEVRHPGLLTGADALIVARQMRGHGGMVSFVHAGSAEETVAMIDRLRIFAIAPSLGGVESLVTQPATTSHRELGEEERRAAGIGTGLVRLSIGLEDADDLIADLDAALSGG
jgi:cystathionine gamma-synthase/methionine-gamma-lyase